MLTLKVKIHSLVGWNCFIRKSISVSWVAMFCVLQHLQCNVMLHFVLYFCHYHYSEHCLNDSLKHPAPQGRKKSSFILCRFAFCLNAFNTFFLDLQFWRFSISQPLYSSLFTLLLLARLFRLFQCHCFGKCFTPHFCWLIKNAVVLIVQHSERKVCGGQANLYYYSLLCNCCIFVCDI